MCQFLPCYLVFFLGVWTGSWFRIWLRRWCNKGWAQTEVWEAWSVVAWNFSEVEIPDHWLNIIMPIK